MSSRRQILYSGFMLLIMVSCRYFRKNTEDKSLIAEFSVDKRIAQAGDSVHFTSNSRNAVTYFWDFGDGAFSEDNNPVHVYKMAGQFISVLKVSGNNQTAETTLKITVITVHDSIIAPAEIIAGQEVRLTKEAEGNVIWKVNDQIMPPGDMLNYTFPMPGQYTIQILHELNRALLNEVVVNVKELPANATSPADMGLSGNAGNTTTPSVNPEIKRTFSIKPLIVYTGDKIEFSTNYENAEWNFGGKGISTAQNGEIIFDEPGKFEIILRDVEGDRRIGSKTVTVMEKVDNEKFSAWLTSLGNSNISANERRSLSLKVYDLCINNGEIPITGKESGVFKDFVRKLMMEANPYDVVTVNANIQKNTNNKITSVELVNYSKSNSN